MQNFIYKIFLFIILLLITSCHFSTTSDNSIIIDNITNDTIVDNNKPAWICSQPDNEQELLSNYVSYIHIKNIIIHCDATTPNNKWEKEDIIKFFKEENLWNRPGYLYWVNKRGELELLWHNNLDCYMDFNEITYGAKGYNHESIHIAYQGGSNKYGIPTDNINDLQVLTLSNLLKLLIQLCPNAKVIGHRDLPGVNKACPSFDVKDKFTFLD